MKAGLVEDLVGIDITDARDYPLVEKETLEPAATAPETLDKSVPAETQRFRAEKTEFPGSLRLGRRHGPDEPELPHIPEAEFSWRFSEAQNEMRMLIGRLVLAGEDELAGHLEMDDEGQSPGEIHQDQFAAAAQAADPTADQLLERRTRRVPEDWRKQQTDGSDLEAGEMWTEAADDRFDFRELGHQLIILDLPPRFLYYALLRNR
jgi:hypothetical protein